MPCMRLLAVFPRRLFTRSPKIMTRSISFQSIPSLPTIDPPEKLEVKLTKREEQVCTLLDECKRDLERKGLKVECRIAGGWVRDKLLQAESNDIDVALSDMMGVAFAEHFVAYLSSKKLPVKSIATIAVNPEQSKHLETAKTTVLDDVELDFVNLRSEEYAIDSRIPTATKFGTPLEDALRRDITINALFYNVHTRSVEDHTGKGLDDLRNKIIRTPLAPKETFRDDPLRVIRCIRFASRLGFKMVPELEAAARDEEIQFAFAQKISRERVGEELDKMLKGRDPLLSMRLIDSLSLQPAIFSVPDTVQSTFSANPTSYKSSLAASTILHVLLHDPEALGLPKLHPMLLSQLSIDKTTARRLFLAAAVTPYKDITYLEKKERPAVEAAIRDGLKFGVQSHYLDGVPALFFAAALLQNPTLSRFSKDRERVEIGLLLREKVVHDAIKGSHWSSSLLFSLVQELVPLWSPEKDLFDEHRANEVVKIYNSFVQRIEELNLSSSVDSKPLLDGREVFSTLNATKPGPWTGVVLAKIIEWQLEHPDGSKQDCVAWLKEERSQGRIVLEDPPKRGKGTASGSPQRKAKKIRDAEGL